MKSNLFVYISLVGMAAIGAAAILMQSASAADVLPQPTPSAHPAETQTAQEYSTPTPTLQSVETLQAELKAARDAEYQTRLQLAALIEDHAQVTAEHERNVIEIARLTETARSLELRAAELTATVIPVMATESEAVRIYQLQQNQFAKEYPALIREKAESEDYAANVHKITAVEIFLQYVFGFAVIVLLSLLVFVVVYRGGRKVDTVAQSGGGLIDLGELEREEERRKMFFRPAVNEQKQPVQKRMRVEIPCPLDEFLQFAKRLIETNGKLTYRSWRDTDVYKYLAALRYWMDGEGFAKKTTNHADEMEVTAEGERFMLDSIAAKKPVPPYYCKQIKEEEKENQS